MEGLLVWVCRRRKNLGQPGSIQGGTTRCNIAKAKVGFHFWIPTGSSVGARHLLTSMTEDLGVYSATNCDPKRPALHLRLSRFEPF